MTHSNARITVNIHFTDGAFCAAHININQSMPINANQVTKDQI